jgi:predicted metalloprotease
VATQLTDFWRSTLGMRVVSYRGPDAIVYYRSRIDSACGLTYMANARYCPDDGTIYLDESWIEGFLAKNDQSWIAILAHEWGHEVQDELGALTLSEERPYLRALELQADCYAGAFMRAAQNQGLRDPQTVADGRRFFAAAGDPSKTTGSHGTGPQRDRWFDTGVGSGFTACLDVFKKEHALPRIPVS